MRGSSSVQTCRGSRNRKVANSDVEDREVWGMGCFSSNFAGANSEVDVTGTG